MPLTLASVDPDIEFVYKKDLYYTYVTEISQLKLNKRMVTPDEQLVLYGRFFNSSQTY